MQPSIMYWLSIAFACLLACLAPLILFSLPFIFLYFLSSPYFVRQAIEAASEIELFDRYEAG